ncbi:MAG TPA: hypothetical protein VM733_17035 [Thermoanaerobaculia bacterium]|nr:hypothetical protein [Thermoanaerobaculia bacterium]
MKKLLAALSVLLLAGCFEIDQSIRLEKNLSGKADFHLGVNFEPMVMIMAQFAHDMEGKKGAVTKEDIEKAKADFKKNQKKSDEKPPSLAEMRKSMPEGIRLLDFKARESDFRMDTDFSFGFDRLKDLVSVKLPSKGEGGDPTKKNVIDSPFEGLLLEEKGDTLTITTKPVNPAAEVKEEAKENAPKMDPETEKMMKDAFKDMRVTYRISAPFTIVSHNATRREGDTLIWEYTMARFEELSKKKNADDFGVRVTYRR